MMTQFTGWLISGVTGMERDHCAIACGGELISFGDGLIRFGGCVGIFSELMNWLVLVGMNGFAWMF